MTAGGPPLYSYEQKFVNSFVDVIASMMYLLCLSLKQDRAYFSTHKINPALKQHSY